MKHAYRVSDTSIVDIVDRQVLRWQSSFNEMTEVGFRPLITVSRQPGSKGRFLARKLAEELGLDFYAGKLIQKVAQNANLRERVVKNLDEQAPSLLHEILAMFDERFDITSDVFFKYLVEMISAVGRVGNAVILGRGANFILASQATLRIYIIEPLEQRIKNVMLSYGISENEARAAISKTAKERAEFIKYYFNEDINDYENYDLIINTGRLSVDQGIAMIREGLLSSPQAVRKGGDTG